METKFHALLDDLLAEVTRREPSYLARFGVVLPEIDSLFGDARDGAPLAAVSRPDLAGALMSAIRHIERRGVSVDRGDGDPLGSVMTAGIFDCFAAACDLAPLALAGPAPSDPTDILTAGYDGRRTHDGVRYFVRRSGNRPLLLINACGIPLRLWSRFLGDESHDFRIFAVESRAQNALEGGILQPCDLASDADDILEALEQESATHIDLLAWCDGGKLAIELVRRSPDRFRKLTLVSASLRGTAKLALPPTAYESNFEKVILTIAERPALAPMFAKMLGEQIVPTDWEGLAGNARARADALLRLPAKEHQTAVRVTVSRDLFLINHAKRMRSDAAYPVDDGIAALALPLMLITGDYDHIANNTIACAALSGSGTGRIHAQISGAGHYCFDLQYPYFKLLMNAFLIDGVLPRSTARLRIEAL
ncbi:MAG TPA: alpha/beta hydrolase [Alphaproteobacteria bacterium]|nr:alpha/beta hydrolase [Alphaproteobacteria bacterium]